MHRYTLTPGDILYFGFYLKEVDPTTGEEQPYDISDASSIVFRMFEYAKSVPVLELNMQIVDGPSGYCRVLVTVPPEGTYSSQVTVYTPNEKITWTGPLFITDEGY